MFRPEEPFAMSAGESASPAASPVPPFADVSCSQCGRSFGPGWHGFSACRDHRGIARAAERRFAVGRIEADGVFRPIVPPAGLPLVYGDRPLAAAVASAYRGSEVRDLGGAQ